jgi:hypothetical protein
VAPGGSGNHHALAPTPDGGPARPGPGLGGHPGCARCAGSPERIAAVAPASAAAGCAAWRLPGQRCRARIAGDFVTEGVGGPVPPGPGHGGHPGCARCAGSPERIAAVARRQSPRFAQRGVAGPAPPCVDRRGLRHCGVGGLAPHDPVPRDATWATCRHFGSPGCIATAGPAPVAACRTVGRTRASAAARGPPGAPTQQGIGQPQPASRPCHPDLRTTLVGPASGPALAGAALRP